MIKMEWEEVYKIIFDVLQHSGVTASGQKIREMYQKNLNKNWVRYTQSMQKRKGISKRLFT